MKGLLVIHIVRREMKKMHTILWLVFASLALSGVSLVFFRPKHWSEMSVAKVNGYPIYFDEYRRALLEIQNRINSLRPLAQAYGMSEEMFINMFLGLAKPEDVALDTCIKEKLLDSVVKSFGVALDTAWFKQELAKSLPQLVDDSGKVNMDAYQRYLERMSLTPSQFEMQRKEDLKREAVQRFIDGSDDVPMFVAKDSFAQSHGAKSFVVAKFPLDLFVSMVKKNELDKAMLEQFYLDNKEEYRIPEKRKATYWILSADEYTKTLEIDPSLVKDFYEKNKSTLFRVAPKIKVRHILIKNGTDKAKELATSVHKQAQEDPTSFSALAKKYSQDDTTAKNGGVVDYFAKGTYDSAFEQAAFRLDIENAISPVVKTKEGYEIIQLVERVKATEKPFDLVKTDIEKNLKTKRSLNLLRADLEALVRSAREDTKTLDAFVQKNNLKAQETAWLSDKNTSGNEVEELLVRKLFSPHAKQSSTGYFSHKNQYVIYRLAGVEKSVIPSFDKVKDTLVNDYINEKAESLARNTMKSLRADILSKKITLEAAAQKYGATVTTTKKASRANELSELASDGTIREKLFNLTDSMQILESAGKNVYYLAHIKDADPIQNETFERERGQIIKQEKNKSQQLYRMAFIASLYRNAKIEKDSAILKQQRVD